MGKAEFLNTVKEGIEVVKEVLEESNTLGKQPSQSTGTSTRFTCTNCQGDTFDTSKEGVMNKPESHYGNIEWQKSEQ